MERYKAECKILKRCMRRMLTEGRGRNLKKTGTMEDDAAQPALSVTGKFPLGKSRLEAVEGARSGRVACADMMRTAHQCHCTKTKCKICPKLGGWQMIKSLGEGSRHGSNSLHMEMCTSNFFRPRRWTIHILYWVLEADWRVMTSPAPPLKIHCDYKPPQ